MVAVFDWSSIIAAAIFTLPGLISAIAALLVHRQVKPSNGRKLSEISEDTLKLSVRNNQIVEKVVAGEVEPPSGDPDVRTD